MRPLVFATRNRGKLAELRLLLPDVPLLALDEAEAAAGRNVPEVVEDRETFAGNAIKKAREVSAALGWPALADDSGLEVDALGGAPGVHSARFAGAHDDAANNEKLLSALSAVPVEQRTARFRCTLAFADVHGALGVQTLTADGTCEGRILTEPRGALGFGYDPLFYCPELGATFAELDVQSKNGVSHRARGMRMMAPRIRTYFDL